MQMNYESPEMEVIELENHDVIVSSWITPSPDPGAGDNETGDF